MSVAPSTHQILGLYRGLLRASHRWPKIDGREQRSMGLIIEATIRTEFRKQKTNAAAFEKGKTELAYLRLLLDDGIKSHYEDKGLPDQVPDLLSKSSLLLSSSSQHKINKRRWTFLERIRASLWSSPPTP